VGPVASLDIALLIEFAFGLLIARLLRPNGTAQGLSLVGTGVLGLALVSWYGWSDESYRLLIWGIPAALIVVGVLAIEHAGTWPRHLRPMEALGDASYSLYLWHGLVIAAGHKFLGKSVTATLAIAALCIAIAFISHAMFEKPAMRFLLARYRGPSAPGAIVSANAVERTRIPHV
jgi:exopolysaccharide production protein ExoZ